MIGGLAHGELAVLGIREIFGGPLEFLHLGRGRRRWWLPLSRRRRVWTDPDIAFHSCIGGTGPQGNQRIDNVRQALVIDVNSLERLGARVFIHGTNRKNRLAL